MTFIALIFDFHHVLFILFFYGFLLRMFVLFCFVLFFLFCQPLPLTLLSFAAPWTG